MEIDSACIKPDRNGHFPIVITNPTGHTQKVQRGTTLGIATGVTLIDHESADDNPPTLDGSGVQSITSGVPGMGEGEGKQWVVLTDYPVGPGVLQVKEQAPETEEAARISMQQEKLEIA